MMNSAKHYRLSPGADPQGTPVATIVPDSRALGGPLLATGVTPGAPGASPHAGAASANPRPITTEIIVLQLNAQKSHPPHTQLLDIAANNSNHQPTVVLIQEPHCNKGKIPGHNNFSSYKLDTKERVRSCIYTSKNINSYKLNQFTNKDITTIGIKLKKKSLIFCSAYLPHDQENPVEPLLVNIITYCQKEKIDLIIGTDSNAHHCAWGCPDINPRGEELFQFLINKDLNIENIGNTPTFQNAIRQTILDLTITNRLKYTTIKEWQVLDIDSLSDHSIISFTSSIQDAKTEEPHRSIRRMKTMEFRLELENIFDPHYQGNLHEKTNYLTRCLIKSFHKATPISRGGGKRPPLWNREIRELKKKLNKLNKQRKKVRNAETTQLYKKTKQDLQKLIKKSRRGKWRQFCKKI